MVAWSSQTPLLRGVPNKRSRQLCETELHRNACDGGPLSNRGNPCCKFLTMVCQSAKDLRSPPILREAPSYRASFPNDVMGCQKSRSNMSQSPCLPDQS